MTIVINYNTGDVIRENMSYDAIRVITNLSFDLTFNSQDDRTPIYMVSGFILGGLDDDAD